MHIHECEQALGIRAQLGITADQLLCLGRDRNCPKPKDLVALVERTERIYRQRRAV